MATGILAASRRRIIPLGARRVVKNLLQDISSSVSGLPPARLRSWISPLWFDFEKTGRDQLEFLTEIAGLRPSGSVLDIACGVGRIAIPLTRFLNKSGRYEGFDISNELIAWCDEKIGKNHSNFHFRVANTTTIWTPGRGEPVEKYVFEYPDEQFDLAYAGSIYTHILPEGAQNYLKQTARVLKPGGVSVSTWLLWNRTTTQATATSDSLEKNWEFDHGDYRLKYEDRPEASVAYEEQKVRSMYKEAGLEILEPLRPDASYHCSRIPDDRTLGAQLHYSLSVVARRPVE